MRLAFVDTPTAADWARTSGYDLIATDNPLLAQAGVEGERIINTDAAITQDEANILGLAAIEFADGIDVALRNSDLLRALDLPGEHVRLGGASSRLLSALFHRGLAASSAITDAVQDVGLGVVDQPFMSADGIMMGRLHNPLQTLAAFGFFGERHIDVKTFAGPASVRRDSDVPSDKIRRFAHLPFPVLAFEILSKMVRTLPAPKGAVYVLGENEALRETLPWLALYGHAARRLGKIRTTTSHALVPVELPPAVTALVLPHMARLPLFREDEKRALAGIVSAWIVSALGRLAADWPDLKGDLVARLGGQRPVVLTNGLFGPYGGLIYAALKETGATVIDFEHGVTTGLSVHSQKKIRFSEAATCDVILCCSENAAASFKGVPDAPVRRVEAMGLADQTRALMRPCLQRFLARRKLGLAAGRSVVFHVNTWPLYANLRPGFGTPTETINVEAEHRLLSEAYAKLPHAVVYKPYPTERFAYQTSIDKRVEMAPNITLSPSEDLRYLRAAADVIVTSNPTSTLGWVVGSNVPVVWLASCKIFPVLGDDNNAGFEASMLTVDIDAADWPERLRRLLDRPLAQIRADWDGKASARAAFYERAITGPEGSAGRRAARIVRELIKGRQSA